MGNSMKTLADLTAPAVIDRGPRLEAEVQDQCVAWMRGRKYWARKFSSISQRSVPDYLFAREIVAHGKNGTDRWEIKFATEFKKEGAPVHKETGCMSTQAQSDEQALMRDAGWFVFECDSFDLFKQTVLDYEQSVCA